MGQLTDRLTKVEQQFRLRAITPEFEILMQLYEKGPTPSATLRAASRASSAAFSLILKRLVGGDLLQVEHDRADRRVRKYDLTRWARDVLDTYVDDTIRIVTAEREGRSHP
ncbi:MAG: MarR family [Pseudomonadota bacterium]|jgi:DNA-binding MarR family transcriptional regulator